ncbi:transcriptional repressor [Christensenellaceae bacterium OttesenSCG-928-K19]|nr:transcriptional repressor [Christensenellaceae bacterium OttesenSCG-928-K19]
MAYSKQREMILKTLQGVATHPTADELYYMLKPDNPGISLATVYRNLNQLVQNGMVQRVAMPGSADRFDGTAGEHLHLVCEGCGAVVDLPGECMPEPDEWVLRQTGCKITRQAVLFYGLCKRCNQ